MQRFVKLAPNLIEAIKGAPLTETREAVARRLGVSERTVQNYRAEARAQRAEAARGVLAAHVEVDLPNALADLTDIRRLARANYEASGDARHGTLWLGAVKATLEHVTPALGTAELDDEIAAEMERLSGRSGPDPRHPSYAENPWASEVRQ
jgi:hypothetical protein